MTYAILAKVGISTPRPFMRVHTADDAVRAIKVWHWNSGYGEITVNRRAINTGASVASSHVGSYKQRVRFYVFDENAGAGI